MSKPKESNSSSSSSGDVETVTIAYTESILSSETCESPEDSTSSITLSSDSSYSQYTEESDTSLFATLDQMKQKEAFFGYEPLKRSMSSTKGPMMNALDYFWDHSTFQLFSFLMSHLLAHTPDDPVPFLASLVDRCLRYRDEGEDPPLLFEDSHVSSVYTALDPMNDGTLTYRQYLTGMTTLGLMEFNIMPEDLVPRNRNVPKDVFIREAKQALLCQLNRLIGKESGVGGSGLESENRHNTEKNSKEEMENADGEVGKESDSTQHNFTNEVTTSEMSFSEEERWRPSKISFKMTPQFGSEDFSVDSQNTDNV